MNKEHLINYRLGYNYVLGTFNPILYYNCYVSLIDEAPYMHEVNHAQICAGSPVHTFGARERLLELFPNTKADYSIINEFRSLFEGIVKAFIYLHPDYRKEEDRLISNLQSTIGANLSSFNDPERDRISCELVALVKELNKERKFPSSRICRQVASALVNCVDPKNNSPRFNEAIGVIKNSIRKLQKFDNPIDLHWKIYHEIIKSKPPNVFAFEAGDIHASAWNALEFFHLALEASMITGNSLPLMKSLSPLLNFILPGYIFPFVLVFPVERKYSIGIYTGEIEMRDVKNRVKKEYCILCSFLQEFIDNIFCVDYKNLSKIQEIYDLLWNFLINVENLWAITSRKCPHCGRPIRPFSDDGRMQIYVLKNLASCKDIFDEAKKSYLEWFKNIAANEANSLLDQISYSENLTTDK